MNFCPVSRQAWAVDAEPVNGSRITPCSGVISKRSRRRGTGFSVMCFRFGPETMLCRNTPGRQRSCAAWNLPLTPTRTYSHYRRNSPLLGRAEGLSHTTRLLHSQFPACRASEIAGSCRQSEKTIQTAPGLATRYASANQSVAHVVYDLWSLLSPKKSSNSLAPELWYFSDVGRCRWLAESPPLEYGGSVRIASTLHSGMFCRTCRASPLYIFASPICINHVLRVGLVGLSVGARGPHCVDCSATGALDFDVAVAFRQQAAAVAATDFFFSHFGCNFCLPL